MKSIDELLASCPTERQVEIKNRSKGWIAQDLDAEDMALLSSISADELSLDDSFSKEEVMSELLPDLIKVNQPVG